ncbi:MAG: insulinase family protein [Firmicutes bacterium]|nr:insulinase family protein [Bacillota bacterium]
METRMLKQNGLTLYLIKLKKFKTIGISLKFVNSFQESTINARSLLPEVLTEACKKYPGLQYIQNEFDALYGTELSTSTQKIGLQSVISFDVMVVNDQFLQEKVKLTPLAFSLLSEIIFHPKTTKNGFKKSIVNNEIRMLKEDIEADYHDKFEYSYQQFKKEMFSNELFKFSSRGIYDSLDEITSENLFHYYETMIQEDDVSMFVVGDFEFEDIENTVKTYFHFPKSKMNFTWLDTQSKEFMNPTYITETADLKQARINIGYRTFIRSTDKLYYAMVLFNSIFGESDQSILFQVVRETHQLCYYISSSYNPNKGFLSVFAGIDPGKEDEACNLIFDSLHQLIQGEISEEALFLAKENLIHRVRLSNDSMGSLINRVFIYQKLYQKAYDVEEIISQILLVTKDEVLKAGKSLRLDTVHTYTKEGMNL